MNPIQVWSVATWESLAGLWQGFLNFIPKLIGAIIIFAIGWFISVWIGKIIAQILKKIKLDEIFQKTKWDEAMEKSGMKASMSDFIGGLVKWVLAIVFLLAAVEILGFSQFSYFLSGILAWLPNLIVAAAIFVVAAVVADFAEKLIRTFVSKMNIGSVNVIGTIVRWAVWVFALLAILTQLGIGVEIIQILVTGFVALIVISAGLAFGLGGRDMAREILEKLKNRIEK